MSDLISRQAAIDAVYETFCYAYCDNCDKEMNEDLCGDCHRKYNNWAASKATIERVINALPSAQQWIPCSERLPKDYEDVLVWFEYFRYGDYNRLYQTHGIGDYSSKYDSWMINHESGWSKLRVFAWMPLPDPWKGENNGI